MIGQYIYLFFLEGGENFKIRAFPISPDWERIFFNNLFSISVQLTNKPDRYLIKSLQNNINYNNF
jgi:hypothetical protein